LSEMDVRNDASGALLPDAVSIYRHRGRDRSLMTL